MNIKNNKYNVNFTDMMSKFLDTSGSIQQESEKMMRERRRDKKSKKRKKPDKRK